MRFSHNTQFIAIIRILDKGTIRRLLLPHFSVAQFTTLDQQHPTMSKLSPLSPATIEAVEKLAFTSPDNIITELFKGQEVNGVLPATEKPAPTKWLSSKTLIVVLIAAFASVLGQILAQSPQGKALGALVIGIYFLIRERKGKPTTDQIPSAIVFTENQVTVVDIVNNDPKGDHPYQLLACQSLVAPEDELSNHLQFERNFGKISKDFYLRFSDGEKRYFTIDTSRGEVSARHYQQDLIQEQALREVFE